MRLQEAQGQSDLQQIYSENNLTEIRAKIDFLRDSMKIRASRSDVPDTLDEELISLEELALTHYWEGLH